MIKHIILISILCTGLYTGSTQAVNCLRSVTTLQNTICNNTTLRWLDSTMTTIYSAMLVTQDAPGVHKKYQDWEKRLQNCTSDNCIERAYYEGISLISNVKEDFDWKSKWWNTQTSNRSGGNLTFSRNAEWSMNVDIRGWAGLNYDDYTAEAKKIYGMALVERIQDTSNCKLLMIPLDDGTMQVYSNADWGCSISMPEGVFLDGSYVKSEIDPRPKPTMLSIGIFTNASMDGRFREMVGEDYQNFVDTANVYIYQEDIDHIGASVVGMWVRGAANSQTAIVMYTPEGKMWAARTAPDKKGVPEAKFYRSKDNENAPLPRTLEKWKQRFLEY